MDTTAKPVIRHTNMPISVANLRLGHSESPLANIVRRTSSKRARQAAAARDQQHVALKDELTSTSYDHLSNSSSLSDLASTHYHTSPLASKDPPQRKQPTNLRLDIQAASGHDKIQNTLHSPLLHSHFVRDSFATMSSSEDDLDSSVLRNSTNSNSEDFEDGGIFYGRYFDAETSNVYSQSTTRGPALRDSFNSTTTGATVERNDYLTTGTAEDFPISLPTLVVSLADDGSMREDSSGKERKPFIRAGRAPIVKPVAANFSRPLRNLANYGEAQAERVIPQLPHDMQEQKKRVLERNATRTRQSPTSTPTQLNIISGTYHQSVDKPMAEKHPEEEKSSFRLHPQVKTVDMMRPSSAASLYSSYSYYPYESMLPSPTGNHDESVDFNTSAPPPRDSHLVQADRKTSTKSMIQKKTTNAPQTAEEYLQLGIKHHEANRLQDSVRCFERSAKEGGGCGVGMLMYGLALRHGWGCGKNEKVGFKWLMKAAEAAVTDLERVRESGGEGEVGVVETELVLAIYEVGQCFFHGWGVLKDQKMAVSYYTVAARLGDGDAQADLAFCLSNGKGCKKDKKEAARWYRAAVVQGQSDIGLAWIYKDKYLE